MKKLFILLTVLVLVAAAGCSTSKPSGLKIIPTSKETATPLSMTPGTAPTKDGKSVYKDGSYYIAIAKDNEGYYANGKMTIKDGKITSLEWSIVDGNKNRVFDKTYEEVFAGNDTYIQQCRDNLKGMENFVPQLIESQDLDQVDAVSGATWAYNKFKEVVSTMYNQAKVQ